MVSKLGKKLPVALSIAGSDTGCGAGVQADLLTFAARRVWGTTVITCLTAQNPLRVSGVHAAPASFVSEQIRQVTDYYHVGCAKTGMLYNVDIVRSVGAFFAEHTSIPLVVDPVMVATSGAKLLQDDAIEQYKCLLFPRATLITPNLDEAEVILGFRPSDADTMKDAARELAKRYGCAVLLKGGHLQIEPICDILATPKGEMTSFATARIQNVDTHGSGCTLSAAITAEITKGKSLEQAIENARHYLLLAMRRSLPVGRACFINHFPTR